MTTGLSGSPAAASSAPITPASFAYVRDLVARESAISLDDRQYYLVQARLAPLARARGMPSVDALVARLRTHGDSGLHSQVVDAMTTNETSFYRDMHAFSTLEGAVLPDLIARRATERRLRIWSAACSTGQEPYSVAMLLIDEFPQLAGWDVRILATDLSDVALDRARAARYSQQEVNRGLPAQRLVRHFTRDGTSWVLRDRVRRLVTFQRLNLSASLPALPATDLVLLRNVLIYFATAAKQVVLDRVAGVLRQDGWLLLGAAESTLNITTRLVRDPGQRVPCYRLQGVHDAHR